MVCVLLGMGVFGRKKLSLYIEMSRLPPKNTNLVLRVADQCGQAVLLCCVLRLSGQVVLRRVACCGARATDGNTVFRVSNFPQKRQRGAECAHCDCLFRGLSTARR